MNAYLVRVDPNGNKNAECRMIQETPERFRVEYGRIGAALLPRRYSNASWDTVYRAHIEKGYKDVTNLYNAGNQEITDFGSASVSALVQEMMNWANAEIEKNYAAGANFGITQNAVDRSQEILNRMSLTNSIPEFNDSLRELFTVIPRKMSDVSAFLVSSPDEFETVIEREQDLLDIAATRIVSGGKEKETVPNPLRTHHIEIQECTEKEKEMVSDQIKKKYYVERDVSWMYFNHRILTEAEKEEVPLLERLSFLGIYSNNLDEFFRVRVASLTRIVEDDHLHKKEIGKIKKTLKTINHLNISYSRLSAIDDISILEDNRIYLVVKLTEVKNAKVRYAMVKVPDRIYGRFIRIPQSDGFDNVMYLDDIVRFCLPLIFIGGPACKFEAYSFKFTKDAEMDIENDSDYSTMEKIAQGVHSRRKGDPVRVIYDKDMPKDMQRRIMKRLNVKE